MHTSSVKADPTALTNDHILYLDGALFCCSRFSRPRPRNKNKMATKIEFDDGTRIMQQDININESKTSSFTNEEFLVFYEIAETSREISNGSFKNVALQLPDGLLPDGPEIIHQLQVCDLLVNFV